MFNGEITNIKWLDYLQWLDYTDRWRWWPISNKKWWKFIIKRQTI